LYLYLILELDIGHPVFSSSVGGLASFSAHPLPTDIHQSMVLTFKFIPHDMEQISLMVFIGQDGLHGPVSDHLAISFIKVSSIQFLLILYLWFKTILLISYEIGELCKFI